MTDEPNPLTQATLADADAFDFTTPEAATTEGAVHAIGLMYAKERADIEIEQDKQARVRVLSMLAAVLQMHEQPHLPKAPYGPAIQFEGRRSAIPSDWHGESVAVLERLGQRATNPVIRARLLDVAWFLERRRTQAGHDAAAAYLAIAKGLLDQTLLDSTDGELSAVSVASIQDALRRGLQITGQLRPGEPEWTALASFVRQTADHFEATAELHGLLAMLNLTHDFALEKPEVCAKRIEALADTWSQRSSHARSDTFVLAAAAWRRAKDHEGTERCLMKASEILATQARAIDQAFSASHGLQQAIDMLRGLQSCEAKDRKRELRIELIRTQAGVEDEMGIMRHPIKLTDIIKAQQAQVKGIALFDGLFLLADVACPREPDQLLTEAREAMARHPLSTLFSLQQHDADGYVRFRAPGTSFGQASPEMLAHKINQDESLTRNLIVEGQIKVVIQELATHFPMGEADLFPLCVQSPFVPTDLCRTYTKGLAAFLHGNMTAALLILTPLLEASLVYVLKAHDLDVVRHDQDTGTQEAMSITQLFENLREDLNRILGQAMVDDLDRVFLARSGPGLRHAVAHGTIGDATPYSADGYYACWLIYRLCLLPLFSEIDALRAAADGGLRRQAAGGG